jgi:uncharacterized membrane protein
MPLSAAQDSRDHVTQTVASLAQLHARAEASIGPHQRKIEAATRGLGRPAALYAIVTMVVGWVAFNVFLRLLGRQPPDPPPFYWLQGLVAFGGLLMTTMVLTTQNRQARHAEERARLDAEVNLLAEVKITKLIALLEELRRDLPNVPNRVDLVAEAMQQSVDPHEVHAALQETLEADANPEELKRK